MSFEHIGFGFALLSHLARAHGLKWEATILRGNLVLSPDSLTQIIRCMNSAVAIQAAMDRGVEV